MSDWAQNPPWKLKPLDEWAIVGMNHYMSNGRKLLYVAMTQDAYCIREEGPDDEYLWNRLWHKAMKIQDQRKAQP